jgi:hypothetical protein
MCICVYVYMCICVYVYVYISICVYVITCLYVIKCMIVRTYVLAYVWGDGHLVGGTWDCKGQGVCVKIVLICDYVC